MEEGQNHPGNSSLKDLYEDFIEEDKDSIKSINVENKVLQRIRETFQGNWEIVELCREILFYNAKQVNFFKERIDETRAKIKELG